MYDPKIIVEELESATADTKDDGIVQLVKDLVGKLKELFSAVGDGGGGDFLKLPNDAEEVNPMDGEPEGKDRKEDGERAAEDVGGEHSSEDENKVGDRFPSE